MGKNSGNKNCLDRDKSFLNVEGVAPVFYILGE
jgi:hypothetical protein